MSWDTHLSVAIKHALDNILSHGDTDIFPIDHCYSIWKKSPQTTIDSVLLLHEKLKNESQINKIECIRSLIPSGPSGFRLGTKIDPLWNIYYLSLTILCAPFIERKRQPIESSRIHSYRWQPIDSESRIFQPTIGWRSFQQTSKEFGEKNNYVLICDIADFYRRLKPELVKNALTNTDCPKELVERLSLTIDLLDMSNYGLPIGGPASRILAEAGLIEIDNLLNSENFIFCRFVDDIKIFSKSNQIAHQNLFKIREILNSYGLSLQKSKTRILSCSEWLSENSFQKVFTPTKGNVESLDDLRTLLMMPSMDPYSEMRAQNDLRLEEFAQKPHALDLLKREFSKSRLHSVMAGHLLSALQFMPENEFEEALIWLLSKKKNINLTPLMAKLLNIILINFSKIPNPQSIQRILETLLFEVNYTFSIPLHTVLSLRILQQCPGPVNQDTKIQLKNKFLTLTDSMIRTEIISLWGSWNFTDDLNYVYQHKLISNHFEQRAWNISLKLNAF